MTEQRYKVVYLNVAASGVMDIMRRVAPPGFDVVCATGTSSVELRAAAEDADFLIAGPLPVDMDLLESARRCLLVQKFGIGTDKIDLEAARSLKIPVAIAAGSNAIPVAEMAVMLMLAVSRRLTMVDRRVRAGGWPKAEMRALNYRMHGKTLGLFGFGNIGRSVAKLVAGFDMTILYHDFQQADAETEQRLGACYVPFEDLLARSDIISLHAPFTAKTRNVIGAEALSRTKPGVILINTARGELVDETALAAALTSGQVRGAGLDTFANEPPAPDNILLGMDQVIVTSHIGGAVIDNVEVVARHAFGNMLKVLAGEPISWADLVA